MKPVFIQSWMISGKYLRSANLPLAMSQMAAMKMWFFYQKRHTTRNNDACTHCGISLISPNTLHQKHSGRLKSFSVLVQFLFHLESGTLFGRSSFRENDPYTEFESLKLEWGYGKWWCNMDWCECCGMKCQWNVVQCGSGGGGGEVMLNVLRCQLTY